VSDERYSFMYVFIYIYIYTHFRIHIEYMNAVANNVMLQLH